MNNNQMLKLDKYAKICIENSLIETDLYSKHNVKRGLRDLDGKGVVTGLTNISTIKAKNNVNGVMEPAEGQLFYRGINVNDIINPLSIEKRFGFEETVYLLLFGNLPTSSELAEFNRVLGEYRKLPDNFLRDIIMKASSGDIMNSLARSVLTLASYDDKANDISVPNVLRQSIQLISEFPLLAVYAFQAYYGKEHGFYFYNPRPELSTAENILYMLRRDNKYTESEARLLDKALILHAEHGGGNNSTFTTHVVTSSGTDTYSSVAASLCSLKGARHGGANIKVRHMFEDIKENVSNWENEAEIKDYLVKILNKEAFDKSGLIYGMGHAIYSVSDPRAELFKESVRILSEEKGTQREFQLYNTVAKLATELISEQRKIYKGVCPNVDFYSGFAYSMLGFPDELFTPIFAVSRIAGWSAHRMEEIINCGKIIRPAYIAVSDMKDYTALNER